MECILVKGETDEVGLRREIDDALHRGTRYTWLQMKNSINTLSQSVHLFDFKQRSKYASIYCNGDFYYANIIEFGVQEGTFQYFALHVWLLVYLLSDKALFDWRTTTTTQRPFQLKY